MGGITADRRWLIAGGLGAALLLVLAWFVFIQPRYAETETLNAQAAAAELRLSAQLRHLAELREQNDKFDEYQAELARACAALPSSSGTSAFLKELQHAGAASGASVTGLSVAEPTQTTDTSTAVSPLPITMTVEGTPAALNRFLQQIQVTQPRAVLINTADATTDTKTGKVTMTLTARVFVADRSGSGTATSVDICASPSPSTPATTG